MYQKSVLSNGIRVVTEELSHVKSISFGVWFGTGSRFETEENHGISHFLEHLVFKGTDRFTAQELAERVDAIGGQINAFTAKEYTCFYMKVLDHHLEFTADLLANMLIHSKFQETDLEKERQVVLEELHMYEDAPEEMIHDLHLQQLWPQHALGRNILGTKEAIERFNQSMLLAYYQARYQPDNMVIAAAGHLQHEEVVRVVEKYFGALQGKAKAVEIKRPSYQAALRVEEKDTEQVHICVSFPSVTYLSPDIYNVHILNNLLGGSMSSRLFQSIREERGLAYSVYSYQTSYRDCGLFSVYAGTRPANAQEVLNLILTNWQKLKSEKFSAQELEKSKEQLKGNLFLGLESSGSRMSRIGRNELTLERFVSLEDVVAKIDAVTPKSLQHFLDTIHLADVSCTALGPIQSLEIGKEFS